MPTPLRSKITYVWRRVAHWDPIYTNTFEAVDKHPSGKTIETQWLDAVEIQHTSGTYEIHLNKHIKNVNNDELSYSIPREKYPRTYSRDGVLSEFVSWENKMLKDKKFKLRATNYFKRHVETVHLPDGKNGLKTVVGKAVSEKRQPIARIKATHKAKRHTRSAGVETIEAFLKEHADKNKPKDNPPTP